MSTISVTLMEGDVDELKSCPEFSQGCGWNSRLQSKIVALVDATTKAQRDELRDTFLGANLPLFARRDLLCSRWPRGWRLQCGKSPANVREWAVACYDGMEDAPPVSLVGRVLGAPTLIFLTLKDQAQGHCA